MCVPTKIPHHIRDAGCDIRNSGTEHVPGAYLAVTLSNWLWRVNMWRGLPAHGMTAIGAFHANELDKMHLPDVQHICAHKPYRRIAMMTAVGFVAMKRLLGGNGVRLRRRIHR